MRVLVAEPLAVNAPLVSPALTPLLQSYINLAERLGQFYIQWVGGPLDPIEIEYAGQLAGEDTTALTAARQCRRQHRREASGPGRAAG